eukprot:PhF_6_TR37480/c1_g1_i1/m.55241
MEEEFQMSDGSAHKTPRPAARSPEAAQPMHVDYSVLRETEQRCAKLLADAECKILEERLRAQERETALREELTRERATKDRSAGSSMRGEEVSRLIEDNRRLEQQIRDLQKHLSESEGRFQTEKRELVKTRANQLMSETSRRGQEGDIIGRAIQVMAEHEAVVRAMEETSLAKLAGYMENFEREWVKRSKEFEERKAVFEAEVMQKAFAVLNQHTNTIQSIEQGLREKAISMLQEQSQAKLALEANLLQQFEVYKAEYKQLCDQEYDKRCKLYDHTLEVRETKFMDLLRKERDKLLQLEREAVKQSELYKVQCLGEAMEEISKLKDDLLQEHAQKQLVAMQDLMQQRETLKKREDEATLKANQRVADMEKQCYEAMQAAQQVVAEMQARCNAQEAALQRAAAELESNLESKKQKEIEAVKTQLESHWKECISEVRRRHQEDLRKVVEEYQERRDKDLGDQFSKEQELRRNYEARQLKYEDAVEAKWVKHVQELRENNSQQSEVVRDLQNEIEICNKRIREQHVVLQSRENEWSVRLISAQREQEQLRAARESELRAEYDQKILALITNPIHSDADRFVDRAEYERAIQELRTVEVKLVEMRTALETKGLTEREEIHNFYRKKLQDERDERALWEQDVLRKCAELKLELEADNRRKDAEGARRLEQERQRLYDEVAQRTMEERRDRDAFEYRVREDSESRYKALQHDLNQAYVEQVRTLEKRMEEKEEQFEAKVRELRMEKRDFEEKVRVASNSALEREKEALREEMAFIHQKLQEEQAKLNAEKQRLEIDYEEKFARAKQDASNIIMNLMSQELKFHSLRDEEVARSRHEEMNLFIKMRHEYDAITQKRTQDTIRKFEVECLESVKREKEALDKKEVFLREELERSRVAMEIAARDRAVKLLDERQKILEEAEERRREHEAELWTNLEKKTLQKEKEFDERRRAYESTIKIRFDNLLETERQRVDVLIEEQRREHQISTERHEAAMRLREEDWVRQRLQIEESERKRREAQYQEVRTQCDLRVDQERRAKEQEVDAERHRLTTYCDEQMAELEKNCQHRLQTLTEDYERRIKSCQQDLQNHREKAIADQVESEKRRNEQREQYETDSNRRTERALSELRDTMERRANEIQQKEIDLREQLEKQRKSYEERIKVQYERMLKEFETQLQNSMREREERAQHLERARAEELATTVASMESKHREHEQHMDEEYRKAVDAIRQELTPKVEGATKALEEERRKRLEAEQNLLKASRDLDAVRGSIEQWKLEYAKSTQQKYDALWNEQKAKSRREREEYARRLLEEEEKNLAKELVRREAEVKREAVDEERSASADSHRLHHAERAVKDKSTVDTIAVRRSKVYQMWQDLETSAEERAQCSQRVLDAVASGDLERAAEELNNEIRRLEGHVPVLDVITRREFVKHKMTEMDVAMQHNPSLKTNPLRQKQMDEYVRELQRLDEHLMNVLPQLESKQGPFYYRGRRYMEVLEESHPGYSQPAGGTRQLTSAMSAAGRLNNSYRTPPSGAGHTIYSLEK